MGFGALVLALMVQTPGSTINPSWITMDDYPKAAMAANQEGDVAMEWDINVEGRIENCRVTGSSGFPILDEASCDLLARRARYAPALDQRGDPIRSHSSGKVAWRLSDSKKIPDDIRAKCMLRADRCGLE